MFPDDLAKQGLGHGPASRVNDHGLAHKELKRNELKLWTLSRVTVFWRTTKLGSTSVLGTGHCDRDLPIEPVIFDLC